VFKVLTGEVISRGKSLAREGLVRIVLGKVRKKLAEIVNSLHRGMVKRPVVGAVRHQQYRELIISPWRVIYRISEKSVYVLSVLDARQNIEDILFRRLTK